MSRSILVDLDEKMSATDYAAAERSIVRVSTGMAGVWHESAQCIVDVSLSRAAMMALGKALIRAAHAPQKGSCMVEYFPSTPDHVVLELGVYLHPQSCRLNLHEQDFGELDSLFKKQPNKAPEPTPGLVTPRALEMSFRNESTE